MRTRALPSLPLLLFSAWLSFLIVFCTFAIVTWTGMAEQDRTLGLVRVVQWACMPFTLIAPDKQLLEYFQPQNRWYFNDRLVFAYTLLSYSAAAALGWLVVALAIGRIRRSPKLQGKPVPRSPHDDA